MKRVLWITVIFLLGAIAVAVCKWMCENEGEDEENEEETSKTDGEKSNQNVDVWLSSNLSSEEFQTLKVDDQARLKK